MKANIQNPRGAFTLLELLVVVAIISIVAMCLARAVKGGIRQANTAKCLANMKNLHNAAIGFLADHARYPYATSHEQWDVYGDKSSGSVEAVDLFTEWQGWVSWIDKDGKRTPWSRDKKSHAKDYHYPKAVAKKGDSLMREAISEGSLFPLVAKDLSTYVCPEHARNAKDKGKVAFLSYAMNEFFRGWTDTLAIVKSGVDPSRMVLFIELDENGSGNDDGGNDKRAGRPGNEYQKDIYPDDCCWDWSGKGKDENYKCSEGGRFTHLKSGEGGMSSQVRKALQKNKIFGNHCHVVFLDGHVGSVGYSDFDGDGELFRKLGEGSD